MISDAQARAYGHNQRAQLQVFSPRFDVRKSDTSFELHGELFGIEKAQIIIEFTGPQIIVIKGKVDRSYTAATPLADWIIESRTAGNMPEGGSAHRMLKHRASIEAVPEEGGASNSVAPTTPATDTPAKTVKAFSSVPATTPAATVPAADMPATIVEEQSSPRDEARYWISERSTGWFERSFDFPCLVDQDGVTATLKDGILNASVPKASRQTGRRIVVR